MSLAQLTREYSARLGILTGDQLQAALDRFDLGRLLHAEPATGGIFGQNVLLTSASGDYVLRGCPHYHWQFGVERYFAELIHERTQLPVPWPYQIDERSEIFGWPYVIMPRMPGLSLATPGVRDGLSHEDRLGIAVALGRALARLHSIEWECCADIDQETGKLEPAGESYRAWTEAHLRDRVARSQAVTQDMTAADVEWCTRLIKENGASLDVPFTPTLIHHDYKEGNVVVRQEEGAWVVSGVFDLMECHFSHPEADFVRYTCFLEQERRRSELPGAFLRGYLESGDLRPGYRERFRLNMLNDCLSIWEFGHKVGPVVAPQEKWFEPGQSFRAYAEPFVSLDPFP